MTVNDCEAATRQALKTWLGPDPLGKLYAHSGQQIVAVLDELIAPGSQGLGPCEAGLRAWAAAQLTPASPCPPDERMNAAQRALFRLIRFAHPSAQDAFSHLCLSELCAFLVELTAPHPLEYAVRLDRQSAGADRVDADHLHLQAWAVRRVVKLSRPFNTPEPGEGSPA